MDASSSFHHHSHPAPKPSFFISWAKLPGGFIKINFDGSKSSSSAAATFVIRDWIGRFLQGGNTNLEEVSVLVIEATAMRNAVPAAVQAGYRALVLEGDNQIFIKVLRGEIQIPWEI